MRNLFLFIVLISVGQPANSQKKDFELSTSVGLGLVEGHPGFSVDGEVGLYLTPKINIGIYYNLMNSKKEINPVEYEVYSVSIEALYLETISNYYTRNIHRSQNSIGLQAKYLLLNLAKFELGLGAGVNYNIYKSLDLTITSSEPFVPHAEYRKWQIHGVSFQLFNDLYYKVNDKVHIGLKSRIIHYKDYNIGFMFSSKIRVSDN